MSLYSDIFAAVVLWTKRPTMVAETDLAIRQALRTAHKAGTFYRDLNTVTINGLDTTQTVQQIDLTAYAPQYRQIAYVKPSALNKRYTDINIQDLFDPDGYYRTDVYYGLGKYLMIRPSAAVDSIELCYYKYPTTDPISSLDSWIATFNQDLIILWAAATVLTIIGEQEVKTRVEALAKLAFDDLIQDSLDITGH